MQFEGLHKEYFHFKCQGEKGCAGAELYDLGDFEQVLR